MYPPLPQFWSVLLSLTHFTLIVAVQQVFFPDVADVYAPILLIPWVLVTLLPGLMNPDNGGLLFDMQKIQVAWREVLVVFLLLCIGVAFFSFSGLSVRFHTVGHPLVFILLIPWIEEVIFRGWLFGALQRSSPGVAIVGSAVLFGIHHLQYAHFSLTPFVLFQVGYTCVLGILFGALRLRSGSIYLSLLLHIALNLAVFFL